MSVNLIYFKQGEKGKFSRPIKSREEYLALRGTAQQRETFAKARSGDQSAKTRLLQFNYNDYLPDGKVAGACHPSRTFFFDCDEEGEAREAVIKSALEAREQIGLLMLERSVHGAHLVCRRTPGRTILEEQYRVAQTLGCPFDNNAHDLARVVFASTDSEEELLFLDDELFKDECDEAWSRDENAKLILREQYRMEEVPEWAKKSNKHLNPQQADAALSPTSQTASTQTANPPTPQTASSISAVDEDSIERGCKAFDLCFIETGLDDEIDTPNHCHNYLLAILSVGLCRLMSKEVLMEVLKIKMPFYYTHALDNMKAMVDDFYNSYKSDNKPMSQKLRSIFAQCCKKKQSETQDEEEEVIEEEPVNYTFPALPPVVREIAACYPETHRAAVIAGTVSALSILMSRVVAKYADGKIHHCNLQVVVQGDQSDGKSFVREAWEMILRDVMEADRMSRLKENEWSNMARLKRGAKEITEAEPELIVRTVPANITMKKLNIRLQRAQGLHLFAYCEEADTIVKSQKSVWSEKSDYYRYAFDNAMAGSDTAAENSGSILTRVFYNSCTLGTPNAISRLYKDCEDGMVSRTYFEILPDSFGSAWLKSKAMNTKQEERIHRICKEMDEHFALCADGAVAAETRIDLDFLNKELVEWLEAQQKQAVDEANRARDTFRRRAAVNAFRFGMVAYILYLLDDKGMGKKEKEEIKAFSLWIAQRCLDNLLIKFGEEYNKVKAKQLGEGEHTEKLTRTGSLYEDMPNVFNKTELQHMMTSKGIMQPLRSIIFVWKRAKLIANSENKGYYIKTRNPEKEKEVLCDGRKGRSQ